MSKIFLNFLTVFTLLLGTSVFSQQAGKLYLSAAGTGRVYDITSLSGGTAPTPISTPTYFNTNNGNNVSNLGIGYDTPTNPAALVYYTSDTTLNSPLLKNGVATGLLLPAAIGGLGVNNVKGDFFGEVYGYSGKNAYRVYPTVSSAIPITGDADWTAGSIFISDTVFDYENNIYTIITNGTNNRYLYKIKIDKASNTATATKAVSTAITGPAGNTTTVASVLGSAYLNGDLYIVNVLSTTSTRIYKINMSTGVSSLTSTYTTDFSAGNKDLASVDYFLPFEFDCATMAFEGNNVFSEGFVGTKTLRVPIKNIYASGTYTINVKGTDFITASKTVEITGETTFIDIPVTYLGTGAAGTRTLTVQLGNSTTECQFTTTVEASFGCNSAMYISQDKTLYDIITTSNPFSFPAIGSYTGTNSINSIAVNPLDGMIYGTVDNTNTLVRINAAGQFTSLGIVIGLTGANFNAGEFDSAGNYYVKNANSNNNIFKINVNTMVATTITLNRSVNVPDIAYNPIDQKFYGVNNTDGRLVSINFSDTPATVLDVSTANSAIQPFGAMFASSTGEIYGSLNAGGFYQFNLSNGQRTLISASPPSGTNDGAHCVNAPITFSADLYVTKTDGSTTYAPGTITTYDIVVGNNGPFGVQGATVADPVPSGIPSANISYTAVVTGNATTSVSGTRTGAIDDLVSLPVGGTVKYTVVVTIPITFSGNLTNNVTITAPGNIIDVDLTNNSATDTDQQEVCYNDPNITGTGVSTNHGITLLQKAGGTATDWPMIRKSAHTVLESNTKGFVITRMTTAQINAIVSPQEGMMVYDTDLKCLKINSSSTTGGWSCFNAPACP